MSEYTGLSASGVGPAVECPTRMAFPKGRTNGAAAKRGNVLHGFCRNVTVNPETRETGLAEIVDEKIRATASKINIAQALEGLDVVACERAYVLNVKDRTVRIAGDNIDRKYNEALIAKGLEPLGKYDIPATIDVVAMAEGVPVELDYKSGQSIGPIKEHWQRKICATALLIHYDAPTVISRVAYIWEDGSIHPDGDEFSCMDVDDFCDEVVATIDKIDRAKAIFAAGKMPDVYPSDTACRYCDALASCPYWTNLAKALLGELQAVESGPDLSTLTPEQMGKVWDLMKKGQKIFTRIEDLGKLMAVNTPLVVDDDWEIQPQYHKGRAYFNDSKARGVIAKLLAAAGKDEDEIDSELASLHGVGKDYAKFVKVKRHLDITK